MKHLLTTLTFFTLSVFAFSQGKVKEKDILGQWKLHIDIKEELKEEIESGNIFERTVAKAVSGLVTEIMERVEITFDFQKKNVLKLYVDVPYEDKEEEETLRWWINSEGFLIIDHIETGKINLNDESHWRLSSKNKLQAFDDDGSMEKNVYMLRVK